MIQNIVLYNLYNWDSAFPVLRLLGPADHLGLNVIRGNFGDDIRVAEVSNADIVVIQREFPKYLEAYAEIKRLARVEGKPLIYDIDDLLLELPPDHPDRKTNFYIDSLLPILQAIIDADAVTTTTPALANYIRAFNKNVFVNPNYLNDQIWKLLPVKKPAPSNKKMIIGYMGSETHEYDVEFIAPVLLALNQKFQNQLQFRFWGVKPPIELQNLSNVEWLPLALYNYREFAHYFQDQHADIFIAPLRDNLFNQCKSGIKFLEYSSLGAPGVFSAVGAYQNIVDQGVNGFLAETLGDWEKYLSQLISNPERRYEIAVNAQKTLRSDWLLSRNVTVWQETYQKVSPKEILGLDQTRIFASVAQQLKKWGDDFENRLRALNQINIEYSEQSADQGKELQRLKILESQSDLRINDLESILKIEQEKNDQLIGDVDQYREGLSLEIKKTLRLSDEIILEQETNQKLQKNISLQEKEINLLKKKLKKRKVKWVSAQEKISVLQNAGETYQKEVIELTKKVDEIQQERADIHSQYNQQVYNLSVSREFQHGAELIRFVDRLAPIGSLQKRLISALYDLLVQFKQRVSRRNIQVLSEESEHEKIRNRRYDVIVFPIINWNFRFQRPQQIATRFAREGHRVFYVNHDFIGDEHATVSEIEANIYEVRLPGRPINIYADRMDKTHVILTSRTFRDLRKKYEIRSAIILVDFPFWEPVVFSLRQAFGWKVVYDCMDDHSGFATSSDETLIAEKKLLQNCDLTITTSRILFEKYRNKTNDCIFLPNAGDFDHFHMPPEKLPAELNDLDHPIIGYYGAISDWFDTHLVARLAKKKPGWQFVLVGCTAGADLTPFQNLENVHSLGEKQYSILPGYLHSFDVCFIPFHKTPLTEATNPVKLFEYLSAGKEVVATNLNELQNYTNLVRLADGLDQWEIALVSALNENSPSEITSRIEFARANTWDVRVRDLKQQISKLFSKASIIVLTYNNKAYTQQCLESIFDCTQYPNIEIIVVDNASTDGTPSYLRDLAAIKPNMKTVLNSENLGFSAGNNLGAIKAEGEFIVFLNNDTVVTEGWLTRLLYHLEDPKIGMVGPVTNWSGNETCIEVDYSSLERMPAFAERYTSTHWDQTFEIRVLPFHCVALRRTVFDEVGKLDERFGRGMFEDDDYALRVRQKGYKVICAEDVFVHHWGKASFSRLDESEYHQVFEENRRKFEEKWGEKWEPHEYRSV